MKKVRDKFIYVISMHKLKTISRFSVFILTVILYSCQQDSDNIDKSPQSSWEVIQTEILEPNCVACHSPGTSFAAQSDLILTKVAGYDQLVNRLPRNEKARNNGLELVGTEGLESLFNSFFWEKINTPDFEHYYEDHPKYGALMPLGGPSLTFGELKYIEEWIKAGAPKEGFTAEAMLLENEQRFEFPDEEFATLVKPEQGIQINIGPFDVAPNFEREFFYYEPLENESELFINRIEITMQKVSHHFILYDFPLEDFPSPQVFRDLREPGGPFINLETVSTILSQRFVFGTQWRTIDYKFPEGVALRIPPDWGLDLNSHYVNRSGEIIQGEVSINLHTVEAEDVIFKADNLFLQNQNIQLPAGKITTLEKTWTFDERIHIFQLFSHAHSHMTEFRIYIVGGSRDGELIYFAKDWQHPPLLDVDPPITMEPGEGLKAVTTYNNDTDRALVWGLFSIDEMMMILGAYYTD